MEGAEGGGGEDAWFVKKKEKRRSKAKIIQVLDCMVFMVSENDTSELPNFQDYEFYAALKPIYIEKEIERDSWN